MSSLLERAELEGWSLCDDDGLTSLFDTVWDEPDTRDHVVAQQLQWFALDGPLEGIDPDLADAFLEEARRFVSELLANDAPLSEYLTSDSSYFDATVAAAYGVPAPAVAWQRSELPAERRGFLTLGAWLVGQPTVSARGVELLRLVGMVLPPHPMEYPLPFVLPDGATTRERYLTMAEEPVCNACHTFIDPPGFALLNFDQSGTYRATEGGRGIDASGEIVGRWTCQTTLLRVSVGAVPPIPPTSSPGTSCQQEWVPFVNAIELAPLMASQMDMGAYLGEQLLLSALGLETVGADYKLDLEIDSLRADLNAYAEHATLRQILNAVVLSPAIRAPGL